MKKNCIVAQSGGPTSAINASLCGVITGSLENENFETCYGALNGITGVISSNYINLTEMAAIPGFLDKLYVTPAMFLGSCRYKLPADFTDEVYSKIFDELHKLNIGAFFYIGGNDSMDTISKLSGYAKLHDEKINFVGIPKTIDNDLCETDHTPGFGSAAKYIAATIREITYDTFIYPVKSVTIIEIMGRDAGWLTAASALARRNPGDAPHFIYLPEKPFNIVSFLDNIRYELTRRNNVIVTVSEGIRDVEGRYICEYTPAELSEYISTGFNSAKEKNHNTADIFGNTHLSGVGKVLETLVKEELKIKTRSIEINVLQRCAAHMASATDLAESKKQGAYGIKLATENKSGVMVTLKRVSNAPYETKCDYAEISKIANEAKSVPNSWITPDGHDITQELKDYILPLIQGEVSITYHNGLPEFC